MRRLISQKVFCILIGSFFPIISANAGDKADFVLIEKRKQLMSLYTSGNLLSSYHVVFGGNPEGHKQKEGDGKTPEGRYLLDFKKENSSFYKAIHVSYPNAKDIENANKAGVPPGGDIMIHGQKNGYGWASFIVQRFNWTRGCIALSNDDMDSVWNAVDPGTSIEIKP